MTRSNRSLSVLSASLAGLALAACSGAVSGITTGSLGGTPAPKVAAAPVPAKPTDRAIQVASTSARAEKCGYNFDAARLRASYLAAEGQQGLAPADAATVEKLYDMTRGKVAAVLRPNDDYCSDEKTREIKADLTRHMAGDFSAKPRVAEAEASGGGLFGLGKSTSGTGPEKLNPDWINDPVWQPRTSRGSSE
jgi:hypothetical protein